MLERTDPAYEARTAASRARVRIVQPEDDASVRLVVAAGEAVWGPHGTLAANELRALVHAGDPVHLALDLASAGEPVVGFAVGFLGWTPVLHVHSHQAGVVGAHQHRGVGYALKLAQRETCLRHGITDMRWTFDPMVRRNTAFNLGALGARATAFHPDFYGVMVDAVNEGDASDRLEAVWDLERRLPERRDSTTATNRDEPTGPSLLEDRDGWPSATHADPRPGSVMTVPAHYTVMRREEPSRAAAWRAAARSVLVAAYCAGLRVGGVTTTGYRFVQDEEV
jgi:predicted GNAT superfamily acetyltransferase